MLKSTKVLFVTIISVSIFTFSGCDSCQQKETTNESQEPKEKISAQLKKEQSELIQKVNDELTEINQKVIELNDKIKEEGAQLSEEQNEALDELVEQRKNVNEKLNKIKNVSEKEWDDFKSAFEEDLVRIKNNIDDILDEF